MEKNGSLPKVAIVIVNWNKKNDVLALLNSLRDLNYPDYEIIVVDNASTDGSVEAIRERFPYVELIVNTENLGGTGGFNTGMRYAVKRGTYKYIWLLDNDAYVEQDALLELVTAMEENGDIGIAGSMILNPDIEGRIVELGGFVSWKTGTWIPYLRNKHIKDCENISMVEVDYVAACSALVRTEAILTAGLMDERFFLHWDDIDFSLRIKKAGYRVVAVSKSKIYHGVEKGFNPLLAYYDIRNGLLMICKHNKGLTKFFYMLNMLRGSFKGAIFSYFGGMKLLGNLLLRALLDFTKGNFYKIKSVPDTDNLITKNSEVFSADEIYLTDRCKILVLPSGNFQEIKRLISILKSKCNCHITLLIQADRKELFSELPIDNYLVFDSYRQSSFKTIAILMKIFFSNYDLAISPSLSVIPFSYAVRKYYLFSNKTTEFYKNKNTVYFLWKLILAFLIGEILSIFLTPVFYLSSFRGKIKGGATDA